MANQANIVNSCSTATLTAIAGSQQITFNGGTLAAGQSCTLSLDVVGVTAGSNFSMSSDLTSSFQNSQPLSFGRACAILEVIPPEDLDNISFSKNFLEDSVGPGGTARLEFSITDNSQSETFSQINFTDDLDAIYQSASILITGIGAGFVLNIAEWDATRSDRLVQVTNGGPPLWILSSGYQRMPNQQIMIDSRKRPLRLERILEELSRRECFRRRPLRIQSRPERKLFLLS